MDRDIIWDVESDGLLESLTKIHSLVLRDGDSGELIGSYADHPGYKPIREGLAVLLSGRRLIGHNVIDFDVRALEKVYPDIRLPREKLVDTLILCQVLWPDIKTGDMLRFKRGQMPGQLIGRQGLEAWGYRLKEHKGEYKEWCKAQGITDVWGTWTPEMQTYCEQDTQVNFAIWRKIVAKNLDPRCVLLEHRVALLCQEMTAHGFPFNTKGAQNLYATILGAKDKAEAQLKEAFPPIKRSLTFIPKVNSKKFGYQKGVPFTKDTWEDFNPASADHVVERLQLKYGWRPTVFTEPTKSHPRGQPSITEDVLKALPYPETPALLSFMANAKVASMMASKKGEKGWLVLERDGFLHGQYSTAGAVTGRATHKNPNIAQIPAISKGKDKSILMGEAGGYGFECRDLFTTVPGWVLVGADMSGLELRCLAHYLAAFDGGAYALIVTQGDVHTVNQAAAGLLTREQAKTFIYAFLYGAGGEKLGSIVDPTADTATKESTGRELMKKFLDRTPGLKRLRDYVKAVVKPAGTITKLKNPDGSDMAVTARGFLIGLDGRPLTIRKAHAALNTLLQSAGAILCKRWLVAVNDELLSRGLRKGWDGDFVILAWVHDEIQVAARTKEIAALVSEVATRQAVLAGEVFNFRCATAGEAKHGKTWAETH